jgi:hypothetical protein
MLKRYVEWDRRYVLIFDRRELFEKEAEIKREIGEDGYRVLVEFVKKWDEYIERDQRFGNILDFTVIIKEDGTVDWKESFATVMYFPTPAPPITVPEMVASMAGHPISTVRSLFEPFFEPPEPIIVYIMRFLKEGKGIVLP